MLLTSVSTPSKASNPLPTPPAPHPPGDRRAAGGWAGQGGWPGAGPPWPHQGAGLPPWGPCLRGSGPISGGVLRISWWVVQRSAARSPSAGGRPRLHAHWLAQRSTGVLLHCL